MCFQHCGYRLGSSGKVNSMDLMVRCPDCLVYLYPYSTCCWFSHTPCLVNITYMCFSLLLPLSLCLDRLWLEVVSFSLALAELLLACGVIIPQPLTQGSMVEVPLSCMLCTFPQFGLIVSLRPDRTLPSTHTLEWRRQKILKCLCLINYSAKAIIWYNTEICCWTQHHFTYQTLSRAEFFNALWMYSKMQT